MTELFLLYTPPPVQRRSIPDQACLVTYMNFSVVDAAAPVNILKVDADGGLVTEPFPYHTLPVPGRIKWNKLPKRCMGQMVISGREHPLGSSGTTTT